MLQERLIGEGFKDKNDYSVFKEYQEIFGWVLEEKTKWIQHSFLFYFVFEP